MTQQLRPSMRYFIKSNLIVILLLPMFIALLPLRSHLSDGDSTPIFIILGLYSLVCVYLLYQYYYILTLTWELTEEQLIYTRGVFAKDKDYLELYRVYDFSEDQTLIDRLLGIKNVRIASTDRSTPTLSITGIKASIDILTRLRKQVEQMKQKHRVYEIANN